MIMESKNRFHSVTRSFRSPLESLLKVLGWKIIFCVYPDFTASEITLVIALHYWLTLCAVAADENYIDNAL